MLITTFSKLPELNLHDCEIYILCKGNETVPVKTIAEELEAKNLTARYIFADSVLAAGIQIGQMARDNIEIFCDDMPDESFNVGGFNVRICGKTQEHVKKPRRRKKNEAQSVETQETAGEAYSTASENDENERQEIFQAKLADYGKKIEGEWAKIYVCVQDAKTEKEFRAGITKCFSSDSSFGEEIANRLAMDFPVLKIIAG